MNPNSIYCVEFPDDALAPKPPRGARARFRLEVCADENAVVLVEHDGLQSVRYLRRGLHGVQAAAMNPGYRPLHAFRIEGVMCMVQQCTI